VFKDRDETPDHTTSWPRRVLAVAIVLVGIATACVYAAGAVSSSHYVVLERHFRNVASGVAIVLICVWLAYVSAFPIRSTVVDRPRSRTRVTMVIICAIGVIVALFFHGLNVFRYVPTTAATSPSGHRTVAYVRDMHATEMHILVGTGLSQKDVGTMGVVCGLPNQDTSPSSARTRSRSPRRTPTSTCTSTRRPASRSTSSR